MRPLLLLITCLIEMRTRELFRNCVCVRLCEKIVCVCVCVRKLCVCVGVFTSLDSDISSSGNDKLYYLAVEFIYGRRNNNEDKMVLESTMIW
jgi:hypothetical protein